MPGNGDALRVSRNEEALESPGESPGHLIEQVGHPGGRELCKPGHGHDAPGLCVARAKKLQSAFSCCRQAPPWMWTCTTRGGISNMSNC